MQGADEYIGVSRERKGVQPILQTGWEWMGRVIRCWPGAKGREGISRDSNTGLGKGQQRGSGRAVEKLPGQKGGLMRSYSAAGSRKWEPGAQEEELA